MRRIVFEVKNVMEKLYFLSKIERGVQSRFTFSRFAAIPDTESLYNKLRFPKRIAFVAKAAGS